MKFVECKNVNWRQNSYKSTKLQKLLEEFLDSGYEVAILEYEDGEYSSVNSVASSLKNSIKRFHMVGVSCVVRDKKAYLVRTSLDEKEI